MSAPPISTGSGIGSPGGPMTPTQREIEASAWTEVNKAMLGIVQDSIEVSFTQMNQRYSLSHLGTHTGYRARENQPMLDHYIDTERSLLTPNPLLSDHSAAVYEELVNQLAPAEFKARFLQEMEKPADERSVNFTAFSNVLKAVANARVALLAAAHTPEPDSLEAARTALNFLNTLSALRGCMRSGSEIFDAASGYIKDIGRNDPNYDQHSAYLNELRDIVDDLKSVDLPALAQGEEGGTG